MNPTDTVSILSMLAEAKTLHEMKKKTSEKYINERIRDYALSVLNNHDNIRHTLTTYLEDDLIYIFGKTVEISVDIYDFSKNYQFILSDGKFRARCHLIDKRDYERVCGYCGTAKLHIPSNNIVVETVEWYTSNTSDKNYSLCSSWRIDNRPTICGEDGQFRSITKENLKNDAFTEKEWRQIYDEAKLTEAYTEKLIEYFKKFIELRVSILRKSVDSDLEAKRQNQSVLNSGTHTTSINITWSI